MLILDGFRGPARAIAFSPDGRTLASAGDGPEVRLWDAITGARLRVFKIKSHPCDDLRFTPTGRELLMTGGEGLALIRDLRSGYDRVLADFAPAMRGMARVWFAHDRPSRLLGHHDRVPSPLEEVRSRVILGDWERGRTIASLGFRGQLASAAFAPGGGRVALGMNGPWALVWNPDVASAAVEYDSESPIPAGLVPCEVPGRDRDAEARYLSVADVAFSPDGRRLLGRYGRTVCCWDAGDGRSLGAFEVGRYVPTAWDVARGRDLIAVGGQDGVRVFDFHGECLAAHDPGLVALWSLRFAPDGGRLAAGGHRGGAGGGVIAIWDLEV